MHYPMNQRRISLAVAAGNARLQPGLYSLLNPRRIGLAIAAITLLATTATARPVEIKLATLAPEGSAWMETLTRARNDIREATEGRVRVRLYPSGIMGEERDVMFKIRAGQLDAGGFLGVGISTICPDAQALMVPMLFESYAEADAAIEGMTPHLEQQSRENGFVVLGWTEVGFTYLLSRSPVRSIEDLRRAKPWATTDTELLGEFFTAARVHALPVPVTDVLTALQTGLLETVFSPALGAVAMQWHTRTRYRLEQPLSYVFGGLFVAERTWRRIREDDREAIGEILARHTRELTLEVRRSNREALEIMAEQGIQTVTASDEDMAAFGEVSRQARERLVGRAYSPEAWTRLQDILREVRATEGNPDS